jgi:hypothetical protein
MSHHPGHPMLDKRLELHQSKFSKVLVRVVLPILLATGWVGSLKFGFTSTESSRDHWNILLGATLCFWLPLFMWVYEIPRIFDDHPKLVIDEQGITDNRSWKPKTMLWRDIEGVSFPYRHSGRHSRSYWLSITFKNPQKHLSKTAYWLFKQNAKLVQDLGHYEIRFGDLNRDILGVYRHIVELQRHTHIPPALRIDRITDGPHTM